MSNLLDEYFELDNLVVLDFHDGRGQKRLQLRDVDDELDQYFDDYGRGTDAWGDDVVTMQYEDRDGNITFYDCLESRPSKPRHPEVALNVKKPIRAPIPGEEANLIRYNLLDACN